MEVIKLAVDARRRNITGLLPDRTILPTAVYHITLFTCLAYFAMATCIVFTLSDHGINRMKPEYTSLSEEEKQNHATVQHDVTSREKF